MTDPVRPDMEFTCRYDVLGPPNGCKGDCEGTGFIPHFQRSYATPPMVVYRNETEDDPPIYRVLWYLAEAKQASDDGWHFLPCPTCRADDPLVQLARAFMGAK